MKKLSFIKFLFVGVLAGLGFSTYSQEYSSYDAREVIQKMVEAHGGLNAWKKSPSFSYDLAMYMPGIPLQEGWNEYERWRFDKFQFDVNTGKSYVNIPWENAQIGFDGQKVWNQNYIQEKMKLPAGFRLFYHFGFINQPFLTQLPGVKVGELSRGKVPKDDREYLTVKITYEPGNGNTHNGYHQLFIDPETYILKAVRGNVRVPLLPGNVLKGLMGDGYQIDPIPFDLFRVFIGHQEVDGITIPNRYTTMTEAGDIMGMHIVVNPSFKEKLNQKNVTGK